MSSVHLNNVAKDFGTTKVIHNLSLAIEDGEFIAVVGPSGSGKSTVLRLISGLEPVTGGTIRIGARDVTALHPKKRNVAMVFQNYALYPHMSVERNILFGMRIRKESREKQQAALSRVVETLHLEGLLKRKPRQLSGGQRQRVAMARAIVREPELFLMDEPLSNLDAKLRNEVRLSIMELHRKLNTTTVYVTHDQVEAMTMADRIVVLRDGIIQQVGTPQELYQTPANLFVARFIGSPAMNIIDIACENGSLRLPNGLEIPTPAFVKPVLNQARTARMGIRPEHILLAPEGQTEDRSSGLVSLTGTLSAIEMLGSDIVLHTTGGSSGLRVRVANHGVPYTAGDTTRLLLDLSKAHFFSAEGKERLC
ncbi:MAG: ABC transporter ATP-binding protein [Pseudodesulfovibrio sp.]|uniref:ABC transporter related protein n=1 Tax=Pseudodesulfovibrio aespoeensis (strain ATCC 700646 / DSM 10631 / Aspo-2) TaxID=643562 RepID=E6VYZ3_PSEA9|nr:MULTISPECIES: ABC transporter ATP-binding protein [Pseudodesulfovibrio]MBU4378447.1 ABC transporter ATP-binding protein [Pseudomonadota bacterium]ADU61656.1 ABC transporter related protein [Pseudodesulfovibrio aespoeensis Aspo-2]MBU4474080.1 ABC transporter ATP-binding protein [Pseudomonadota bacterium]MBU4517753.1 ABC transporter ATP-binding protein [Pseudomonadota bacterium]MBU4522185.1 ABC transporter ATP-binding protein [Pseudomonadota bacterium]